MKRKRYKILYADSLEGLKERLDDFQEVAEMHDWDVLSVVIRAERSKEVIRKYPDVDEIEYQYLYWALIVYKE